MVTKPVSFKGNGYVKNNTLPSNVTDTGFVTAAIERFKGVMQMKKSGFTLLEVLVGTAVLAMMVTLIWSISSTSLDAEDRVQQRDQVFQMARFTFRRFTEDVNTAYLVTRQDLLGKTRDGASVEMSFIGADKGQFDTLDFNSMSNWRMFRDSKESDQSEIGYYVEADPEDAGKYRLMRRTSTVLDNDVTQGGRAFPVAEGITKFGLSYYDVKSGEWSNSWNSEEVDFKNRLPRAVKVELSFQNPADSEESIDFSTIAFIELWQQPLDF